jgi:archaellum biogenesis ATPase FlaH
MPLGDIARVLDDVSPDDYAVWRNVGFALAHEYGSDGLDIFIKWSKKSSKFKSNEDCEKVFRDKPVKNPVTLGTVLAYAKQPPKRQLEPRHDLWNTKDLKRTDKECLLNNLALQRGEIMMLNAATGVGKSVFAFQLASYFYMGRETCGLQPNGTMNVMVIEGEDTIYTVRRKMLGVTQFFTPQEREQVIKNANVFFFKGKCGATFLNSLEDHIIEYKPDFVIVNPIAKFFGGNMIDPEQVSHFMGSLETIAEKYNLGMLLIGHFKKQSKKSQEEGLETAYAGFGSAKWGDSAREVMSLRKVNDKVFELATSKRSWECGFKSITLLQSSSSELPFWEHVTDIKRLYDIQTNQKENPNVKKIINAMPPNGGKTTYSELSKRTGLSQPTIRKWKKSAGIVTEERDGIETQLWIEPCNLKNPEKP